MIEYKFNFKLSFDTMLKYVRVIFFITIALMKIMIFENRNFMGRREFSIFTEITHESISGIAFSYIKKKGNTKLISIFHTWFVLT